MSRILAVKGRQVWDSRGHPTVEVEVGLADGTIGRAIAPAGASRGSREATDLRDGGPRLKGLGVKKALAGIAATIAPALFGADAADQRRIDDTLLALDPSPLKATLGGNATVAVSMAVLRAAAASVQRPLWQHIAQAYRTTPVLPLPEIQIFGGGAHAGGRTDIQDFMVMVPGAASLEEAFEVTAEIYHAAGALMTRRGKAAGLADEGGWWPDFASNEEALETLVEAIVAAGETPGDRVVISLDIAASEFRRDGGYRLALEDRDLSGAAWASVLARWLTRYPIASIEDPLGEDDTAGMAAFTTGFGGSVQIIGDDYLVTNAELVAQAARAGACNAVLLKVNQAGTVSELIDCFRAARAAGWGTVVSARSGETEDTFIADLAIGLGAGQLKVGSFARSERMAKWNQCLRIAEAIGPGRFAAGAPLTGTWWSKREQGTDA